jgi:predicted adenine nucleotide alpha hydrolase (AANH) superfamily ATPase
MTRVLLHVCCGPCLAGSLPLLEREGFCPTGFFYNPNIHLLTEARARIRAVRGYAGGVGFDLTVRDDYGLVEFVRMTAGREAERCVYCYTLRLRETAREAARRDLPGFTTTLLHSPTQKHDLIRDVAGQVAREEGVAFRYVDLRPGWDDGQDRWKVTGLYRQKYCGCIYSEMDRFGRDEESNG